MKYLFLLILLLMMVALVLYLQLLAHKDELDPKHKKYFDLAHNLYGPLLKLTGGLTKPYQVGPNLSIDLGPAILMTAFALLSLFSFIG